jgi:hypothetical protein
VVLAVDHADYSRRPGAHIQKAVDLSAPSPHVRWLAGEVPLRVQLGVAVAVSAVVILSIFPPGFITGASPYWADPRGVVQWSWADMSTAVSGALFFQQDHWTLPLFHVSRLGAPSGTTIILTDSVPVVCVLSRLAFHLIGRPVNPFGVWTVICYMANAVSLTWLVSLLGGRSVAAALAASVAGLCMPALLYRFGHLALLGQFEIVLALAAYVLAVRGRSGVAVLALACGIAWLALWTEIYIFIMVAAILAAALAQRIVSGTDARWRDAAAACGAAAFIFLLAIASGFANLPAPAGSTGYGLFSLNLMSPFLPQWSGAIPAYGGRELDVTGGQYEGFSYFGAGVLLLLALSLPGAARLVERHWRQYVCLATVCGACLLIAVSNRIFFGTHLLAAVALPGRVHDVLAVVRSSGRFVWPTMYGATALAIACASRLRFGGAWLVAASLLQLIDTAPLRHAVARSVAAPARLPLDAAALDAALLRHHHVTVTPAFLCIGDAGGVAKEIALQVQLQAGWRNRATNTVYAGRAAADCTAFRKETPLAASELRFYVPGAPVFEAVSTAIQAGRRPDCRVGSGFAVCSSILQAGDAWPVAAGG